MFFISFFLSNLFFLYFSFFAYSRRRFISFRVELGSASRVAKMRRRLLSVIRFAQSKPQSRWKEQKEREQPFFSPFLYPLSPFFIIRINFGIIYYQRQITKEEKWRYGNKVFRDQNSRKTYRSKKLNFWAENHGTEYWRQ